MFKTSYRIRKDKHERYLPEKRDFTSLWLWERVPDIGNVLSMFGDFSLFGLSDKRAAERIIENYKNYKAKKEEITYVE